MIRTNFRPSWLLVQCKLPAADKLRHAYCTDQTAAWTLAETTMDADVAAMARIKSWAESPGPCRTRRRRRRSRLVQRPVLELEPFPHQLRRRQAGSRLSASPGADRPC
jgi:hypothetical protein